MLAIIPALAQSIVGSFLQGKTFYEKAKENSKESTINEPDTFIFNYNIKYLKPFKLTLSHPNIVWITFLEISERVYSSNRVLSYLSKAKVNPE